MTKYNYIQFVRISIYVLTFNYLSVIEYAVIVYWAKLKCLGVKPKGTD